MGIVARLSAKAPGAATEAARIASAERQGGIPAKAKYEPRTDTYVVTTTPSPEQRGKRAIDSILGR